MHDSGSVVSISTEIETNHLVARVLDEAGASCQGPYRRLNDGRPARGEQHAAGRCRESAGAIHRHIEDGSDAVRRGLAGKGEAQGRGVRPRLGPGSVSNRRDPEPARVPCCDERVA